LDKTKTETNSKSMLVRFFDNRNAPVTAEKTHQNPAKEPLISVNYLISVSAISHLNYNLILQPLIRRPFLRP
jgi:hypothetical protein